MAAVRVLNGRQDDAAKRVVDQMSERGDPEPPRPAYNHTRADGPEKPCTICKKARATHKAWMARLVAIEGPGVQKHERHP